MKSENRPPLSVWLDQLKLASALSNSVRRPSLHKPNLWQKCRFSLLTVFGKKKYRCSANEAIRRNIPIDYVDIHTWKNEDFDNYCDHLLGSYGATVDDRPIKGLSNNWTITFVKRR